MASPAADLAADSRLKQVLLPALDQIIKNASWRKHSKLAHESKSLIEKLTSSSPSSDGPDSPDHSAPGPLNDGGAHEYSLADSELILSPLINALTSGALKISDPALDCVQKLISHGYLRGEADSASDSVEGKLLCKVIEAVCKFAELGDEAVELLVLKTLLSAVTSSGLRIHGDCLLLIVRTCYDVYLGSKNVVNQTTAKASLIQMLVIVFWRMEADSSTVPVQPIVVAELMEPVESAEGDQGMMQFVQGFITKIVQEIDVVLNPAVVSGKGGGGGGGGSGAHDGAFETRVNATVEGTNPADLLDSTDKDMLDAKYWEVSMYKSALEGRKGELADGEGAVAERDDDLEVQIGNKLRRDAFLFFRALCKLSMKTPPKDALSDPQLMRGKIVALELLKILLENAGAVFRTSERFLGAIKQYLCLSLLKNSASTLMIVFQLSCSIFISLVARFRAGLKAEIGVFFPMIVLRVLENVSQPNFQQKMIVLKFLEKLCEDSQILVDIFINYDCDVNSSNIFERMVNGLLKTAQGVPAGAVTTLLPPQEATMKFEAMKCLVAILKSMGDWMNKQLRIPDTHSVKKFEYADESSESVLPLANGNAEELAEGSDSHSETVSNVSDAQKIEQRRAYKLELQEGISLFNRKPKKGIEFLINANKVGNTPDEIAAFLRNASGLNKTLIGECLGEREELSLKVMHSYVDSFDFQGMELDEAIRAFLQGFRLPGEAQKIDRIMEKFAERYCKCNPKVFSSADTAYVLSYSVILLNTDAHNPMVKNKMSAEDFIKNNRGIDDGKDLPEEYMKSLYERITRKEIKMKDDDLAAQQKQSTNSNRILGLDNILNIVTRKRSEASYVETSDGLIKHMQEQFKEKARKSESVYYAATDVVILRFMIEVCWAPMLAAFSVPLDQSDDEIIVSLCLEGFQCAVHVTSVMSMKTHRDAFVTSLAKFTSLHSPADIKQKNISAIKEQYSLLNWYPVFHLLGDNSPDVIVFFSFLVLIYSNDLAIINIADEDGNYLQEAWEHIMTCVSRFEHLHLLGEGAPPDAAFFAINQNDLEKSRQVKSRVLPVLKKKGVGKMQYAAAAVMRGSYDGAGIGGNVSGSVTSEQMNNLVSNLNMLGQVGSAEMNRIFTRSQKLNSEAIIDFVKALCKVSMEELRSASDPRVFSLTKIVEIAHYNMNRIRLVWSSIWHVLSDFFITIGCSENLSIAIFAMDSLRQLSMKFLDREELANYNFQNEFMKPFVIVMQKSSAVEIRELIIRCISQMVLSRVINVKSGWKSMFMVLTTAAYDYHKNIVLLAFEIMEKIVRDYFPFITETETTTFTDCVNCLIAFTNSRFNKDISLNAIAFLRFCAEKLAEGNIGSAAKNKEVSGNVSPTLPQSTRNRKLKDSQLADKDDHLYSWFPLLAGLSELSLDPRPEIRKSALQILFDALRNHGHLFSLSLWERVFESVLFCMFDYVRLSVDPAGDNGEVNDSNIPEFDQDSWLYETCTLSIDLVVDLFVKFYYTVNPLLRKVLTLLVNFIKRPHQSLAGIGIAAFVRLVSNSGDLFSDEKWLEVVISLKEAATTTLPDFSFMVEDVIPARSYEASSSAEVLDDSNGSGSSEFDLESARTQQIYAALSDAKCRCAVQLLLIQAIMEIYSKYRAQFSMNHIKILFEALHVVALHAHEINSDAMLCSKLLDFSSITQMQDPPLLRLENESYQICLTILLNLLLDQPQDFEEVEAESYLVGICREILQFYIEASRGKLCMSSEGGPQLHWQIPLGSRRRRELTARAPLIVGTLQAISNLEETLFERNLAGFFPLFSGLISCEHGSKEVQVALSEMLGLSVGPVLLRSC
ncbi:Brefeldin A-inhibited guanine nucleotide-exchange protein 2-like protein [Drosera capensis]